MKLGPLTVLALVAGAYYLGQEAVRKEMSTGLPVSPYMQLRNLASQAEKQYKQYSQQYGSEFYSAGK